MERVCPVCGEMFLGRGRQKYCSRRCGSKVATVRRREGIVSRPNQKTRQKICELCGESFMGRPIARFCSKRCQVITNNQNRQWHTTEIVPYVRPRAWFGSSSPKSSRVWTQGRCSYCSAQFIGVGRSARYCSTKCARNAAWLRRYRARGDFKISPRIRFEIYERDGWLCHLCGDPVDVDLHYLEAGAATLDHVIPQSVARDDSPENLRLAHRSCNSLRGARLLENTLTETV